MVSCCPKLRIDFNFIVRYRYRCSNNVSDGECKSVKQVHIKYTAFVMRGIGLLRLLLDCLVERNFAGLSILKLQIILRVIRTVT